MNAGMLPHFQNRFKNGPSHDRKRLPARDPSYLSCIEQDVPDSWPFPRIAGECGQQEDDDCVLQGPVGALSGTLLCKATCDDFIVNRKARVTA